MKTKQNMFFIYSSRCLLIWEISAISLEREKGTKNEPKNKCKNRLAAKEFTYSIIFLP